VKSGGRVVVVVILWRAQHDDQAVEDREPVHLWEKKRKKVLVVCSKRFFSSWTFQGEEPLDTGGGRVSSLDASSGLLATASASAPALFLGSALCCCGVSCMYEGFTKKNHNQF